MSKSNTNSISRIPGEQQGELGEGANADLRGG